MSFSISVAKAVTEGSSSVQSSNSHTVEQVVKMAESIADSTTDKEFLFALDISNLKVFSMVSDYALTVKTNSSSTAQETFSLAAGKPVIWETGETAIFAGDVTALYVSNSSGSAATLKIIAGLDAA